MMCQKWTRETRVWLKLDHPNILRLRGIIIDETSICPSLVTEWMVNGSLKRFLEGTQSIDKLAIVSSFVIIHPRSHLSLLG